MKSVTKFLSVLILVPALLLAGCSPQALSAVSLGSGVQPVAAVQQVQANPAAQAAVPTATPVNNVPVTAISAPVAANSALATFEGTLEQVYAQVNPSVVNIDVTIGATGNSSQSQSGRNNPFGFSQGAQEALGSGFVWDAQGHIVTNNHVVSGATTITVTFADGSTYDAKLVGADPNADLAVIQVNAPASELHPVAVGDSTQVKVGQLAIAIGNPFGLSGTMTEGIISALQRSLPVGLDNQNQSQQTGPTYSIPDIIQTDAAINPGNSGGVLVNDQGQVIGVTAAIQSATNSNAGIGFVIPSAIVKKVVPSLIQTGAYNHPYLGISGTSLTSDVIQANNLKAGQKGVLIVDVAQGGPAAQAGIQGSSSSNSLNAQGVPVGGDIVTAINGHAINSIDDLTSYLFNNTQAGQTVNVTILRQGAEKTVQVKLGVLPTQASQ